MHVPNLVILKERKARLKNLGASMLLGNPAKEDRAEHRYHCSSQHHPLQAMKAMTQHRSYA